MSSVHGEKVTTDDSLADDDGDGDTLTIVCEDGDLSLPLEWGPSAVIVEGTATGHYVLSEAEDAPSDGKIDVLSEHEMGGIAGPSGYEEGLADQFDDVSIVFLSSSVDVPDDVLDAHGPSDDTRDGGFEVTSSVVSSQQWPERTVIVDDATNDDGCILVAEGGADVPDRAWDAVDGDATGVDTLDTSTPDGWLAKFDDPVAYWHNQKYVPDAELDVRLVSFEIDDDDTLVGKISDVLYKSDVERVTDVHDADYMVIIDTDETPWSRNLRALQEIGGVEIAYVGWDAPYDLYLLLDDVRDE